MVLPIATAYIADITPKNQEGAYIGYFQAAFFSGFGFGPLMGGFVKDLLGINANFYAMGILSLIALALVLLRIPECNQITLKSEKQGRVRYRHMLKGRIIKAIFIIRFATAFGRGTVLVFFPVFAYSVLHLSATQIGIAMSTYVLLTGILQRPFGKLADHWNRTGMVILGSLLSVCAICLFPFTTNMRQVIILSLLMALGGGVSLPAITAITVRYGKKMGYGMGMLMGLFYLAMATGLATGPILNGAIFDRVGLEAPFYFGGLILLAGTLLFTFLKSEYRMSNKE
jgi:MFS family permease